MNGKHRAPLLAAALALIATNAASAAENQGLYFGLFAGTTSVDTEGSRQDRDEAVALPIADLLMSEGFGVPSIESSLDDSDLGWGLEVGYRFNRYLAAEVGPSISAKRCTRRS